MSQIEGRIVVDMSKVVLLVEREEVAPSIELALRPLNVVVEPSIPTAQALAKKPKFGVVLIGYPSVHISATHRIRLAPAAYDPARRRATLRKPFGQSELSRVLSEVWQSDVLLRPLESGAQTAEIAGRVREVGVLELAIAQLQPEFGWSNLESDLFLSYLHLKSTAEIAKTSGVSESTVLKHISHATKSARSKLDLTDLRPAGLRAWILRRMLGLY